MQIQLSTKETPELAKAVARELKQDISKTVAKRLEDLLEDGPTDDRDNTKSSETPSP